MSTRVKVKQLKGEARLSAVIENAKKNLAAANAPAHLIRYLENLWNSALSKTTGQLTDEEKRALTALLYLSSPSGFGVDVRRDSRHARTVHSWLKASGKDIPDVDTPMAQKLYGSLRRAYKTGNWERFKALIEGKVAPRGKMRPALPTKRTRQAKRGTTRRKKAKTTTPVETIPPAAPAPEVPAPEVPAPEEASVELKPEDIEGLEGIEEILKSLK